MPSQARLITAFLICTSLAPATWSRAMSDRERDELVGPVRSVRMELAEARTIDGKLVEVKRRPHQHVTYNERGQEVERVNFNPDGSIESRSVQKYDSQGRNIGWKDYGDAGESSLKSSRRSSSDYDSNGNLLESRVFNGGVLELRLVYTYDDNGRKIGQSRFADNGTYHGRLAYAYNAAGQETEMTSYYTEVLSHRLLKTYDASGNLLKETSSSPHQSGSNWTVEYVYDNRGREIEKRVDQEILWSKVQTSYDADGRVARRDTSMEYKSPNVLMSHAPEPGSEVFRYDERGQVIEQAFYAPDGALLRKTASKFSEAGKLIEQTYFKRDGTTDGKVSYEYDYWGNCVKKAVPSRGEKGRPATFIEYRTISYY